MEGFRVDLIGEYINGNYTVKIYEDGTKIRETKEDEFISSFPESIDLKITNRCNMGVLAIRFTLARKTLGIFLPNL